MKTVMKKIFSLMMVAVLLVSAVPFAAFAAEETKAYDLTLTPGTTYSVDAITADNYTGSSTNYWVHRTAPSAEDYVRGASFEAVEGGTYTLYVVEQVADPDPCAGGHTPGDAATCTAAQTCTVCGTELAAALGHTPGDAATCTTAETCTVCNAELTPALGHTVANGICTVCGFCETCQTAPCSCPKPLYTVVINVNKDGANRAFSRAFEEGTTLTLAAELVEEVSFGNATVKWIVDTIPMEKNSTVTVNGPMTISCSITNNATEKKTITLYANGGRLQSYESAKYTVVLGQVYGNLPEPTRAGHTFAYWYYLDGNGNEHEVGKDFIVEGKYNLYAKWIAKGVTVVFQRYDMLEGWVDVEKHTVPYNSTLSVEDGTFPSSSRIDVVYKLAGFNIVGWEIGESDNAFKAKSTKVTGDMVLRPRYQGQVKLRAQEPVSGASWKSFYVTLEIGEPIGKLKNPGPRSTFAFNGWVAENGSNICNEYSNSTIEYDPRSHGTTFTVDWADGVTVRLHIHTNGNTATASKIIPYYVAPGSGKFDLNAINMYSIYGSYHKYDDACDVKHGWYDAEEWKNYCANRAAQYATSYLDINDHERYDFHIMLIDNGEDSSSSSSAADSSNPKTGDMIMTPVIVLCASVGALATLFYLNKKRSI